MAYAGKPTTLTATFQAGVPAAPITATGNGAAVPVSNLRVVVNSGSGATAKGFLSFETVLPAGAVTIAITAANQSGAAATHTTDVRPASEAYAVPAALPVAFMPHGASSPVGFRLESKPGFAKGYLRPDQHLVGTVDGQAFEIQQDREPLPYSDGSVRAARLTWAMPVAAATDTAKAMTVSVAAGAPNRTPWITPQAIVAADDWQLRATGMDLGGTVLTASLRDIVTNGLRDDWSVGPKMGWDVLLSGPQQVGLRAWQMLDAWRKAWIYVIYHADGKIDHQCMVTAPNWDGPVPGAAAGPLDQVTQRRSVCAFETFRNGTRVAANGGPNDPRVVTVAANMFTSNFHFLRPPGFEYGMCVAFTPQAGGTMPSGLTAGTPYWLGGYGDTYAHLHAVRRDVQYNDNIINTGTNGTGNLTMTPWISVHPFGGSAFMDTDARPYRIGGGKLDYGIQWDEKAMSSGAQMFPRYDQNTVRYPSAGPAADYYPQSVVAFQQSFNNYGDDPGTDWVGLINETAVLALLNPFDANFCKYARTTAAALADWPIHTDDIASGRPIVCDNGPGNSGGAYPRMGASRPYVGWNSGGNQPATSVNYQGNNGPDASGYTSRYSSAPLDGSHVPSPGPVPAHHTGNPLWDDLIFNAANCVSMSDIFTGTYDGVTYIAPVGMGQQPRGEGWAFAYWINAETFMPASRPEAAYGKGRLDLYEKWCVAAVANVTPANLHMGHFGPISDAFFNSDDIGFFAVIYMQCICRELARGERPGMRVMAAALANVMLGVLDESDPAGGSTYFADTFYHPLIKNSAGVQYPDIRTMLADQGDFGNTSPPFPVTAFRFGNHQVLGDAFASTSQVPKMRCFLALAASSNLVSLNGNKARDILARLEARVATAPCVGWEFSSTNYNRGRFGNAPRMFPVHMIVPFEDVGAAVLAPASAPAPGPDGTLTGLPASIVAGQSLSAVTYGQAPPYFVLYRVAGAVEEGVRWPSSVMPGNLSLLIPQTAGAYTVRGYAAASGGSPTYESAQFNVTAAPGALPVTPTQAADTGASSSSVTMNWTATSTSYRVLARPGLGTVYGSLADTTVSTNSFTFTGRPASSSPRAVVIPQNANGYGTPGGPFGSFTTA